MALRRAALVATLAASVAGAGLTPAMAAGETPPPLPGNLAEAATWYVVIDGQTVGPLTDTAVQRRMSDGTITDETLVWRAGMDSWQRADQAPGMQAVRIEARLLGKDKPTPTDNAFAMGGRTRW